MVWGVEWDSRLPYVKLPAIHRRFADGPLLEGWCWQSDGALRVVAFSAHSAVLVFAAFLILAQRAL